uniref:Uncharacterized protein n=1 Tax=Angiostrongylus cantonensis TaxID=6313 RepID=A0A0K0D799_ANGCA
MLARKRRRLSKPVLIHIFLSDSGCEMFERIDVHGQTRVDEKADAEDSSTAACSEEQFFSSVIDSVVWVASSRLGQADDVVTYHSCLHEQVLYGGLGCKCTCIIGTDRHHSS